MRVFNFSAGPSVLPLPVLEQVRAELTDWQGSGMSVMEVSHRSKAFEACAAEAEADLRELLAIPPDYRVLFMQGGASLQFATIPLNLARSDSSIDFIDTGHWSKKAIQEAGRYAHVHIAADAGGRYTSVPTQSQLKLSEAAAYLHYTTNETIGGVEFSYVPETRAPLVADMSSTILSRPIDVSRFGLIYAGAQKNIGPAGLCLVIVREALLGKARAGTPSILDYQVVAEQASMLNTPPTFAWYVAGLVFKWLKAEGGLQAMGERNRRKAELLYQTIDESDFYRNPVERASRSWMNVPFVLARPALDSRFAAEAAQAGLVNLAGHRAVGGMRASLYNAMGMEGVQALTGFMREFAQRHG